MFGKPWGLESVDFEFPSFYRNPVSDGFRNLVVRVRILNPNPDGFQPCSLSTPSSTLVYQTEIERTEKKNREAETEKTEAKPKTENQNGLVSVLDLIPTEKTGPNRTEQMRFPRKPNRTN